MTIVTKVQAADAPGSGSRRGMMVAEPRRAKPVKWWAAAGACFVVLQAYVFSAWIVSGKATPTPQGPTPVPGWMKVVAWVCQILGPIAAAGFCYWFLIRPWRRERRISVDGMFLIAIASMYWQDPLLNYTQNWATINTYYLNWGSWTTNIPGWLSPNGNRFGEAILFSGPAYIYAVFAAILVSNAVMRRAKQRWPQLGTFGLIMVCYAFIATFDLFAEGIWARFGLFTYAGSIKGLTIFHGHYYQFPLYEPLLFGGVWTTWACLRYFKNDKGQTIAERGVDLIVTTDRRRMTLRTLALVGALNVFYLVGYNIPIQWFSLHADPWPEDVTNRSYFTSGICGPGTDYACSGPGVPIPRPDSAHVGWDGSLQKP